MLYNIYYVKYTILYIIIYYSVIYTFYIKIHFHEILYNIKFYWSILYSFINNNTHHIPFIPRGKKQTVVIRSKPGTWDPIVPNA